MTNKAMRRAERVHRLCVCVSGKHGGKSGLVTTVRTYQGCQRFVLEDERGERMECDAVAFMPGQ